MYLQPQWHAFMRHVLLMQNDDWLDCSVGVRPDARIFELSSCGEGVQYLSYPFIDKQDICLVAAPCECRIVRLSEQ